MDLLSTLIALAGLVVVIVAVSATSLRPLGTLDPGKLGDYPSGRAAVPRD